MDYRSTIHERNSRASNRERDVPSFIEPRPPLILNPFMRPRPQKGTNLLELFEEDSIEEEVPELVQVYLRLKPSNVQSNLYEVRSDRCLITSVDTATAGHGRRTQHNVSKMYTFSHIFGPDANQEDIFEHVVKNNLRKLPDGHNFTLLTYGASGSGKTYTLMGTVNSPGLVPRALEYVFEVVDAAQSPLYHPGENGAYKLSLAEQDHELQWVRHLRQVSAPLRDKYRRMSTHLSRDMTKSTIDLSTRTKHYVWVSFVEIYNEAIYDLLATSDRTAASKLRIREDSNGNAFVKGATQAFVRTGKEAYDVMVAGKHNLQVHATGVHAQSSRSHCIFTITMLTETELGVRAAHVRLCDLAGSERARRTRNTGARMQESRAINTSLHVLERCLHTLRRRQARAPDMVPYRESKLTRLLGAGLSGARGEAVSMVVTLNPAPEYAHETRHVLQLAAVARDIQVNNTIAESISTLDSSAADTTVSGELMVLRADNERLHYELMQAQSLTAKLLADMAEKQEANAVTVKELVAEARDIEQQYFTEQIKCLENRHSAEIAELREEYEALLSKKTGNTENGTPSRASQKKIMQLMQQIAILEEELSAEKLARARMDEELQHLRACIEERDEKASDENSKEDAIQLTDSESDSEEEDDLCNESLEPTFKKEDINRSRLMRRSTLNRTDDTFRATDETYDVSNMNSFSDRSTDCPDTVRKANLNDESKDTSRGTFFVESKDESKHSVRETYFVSDCKSVNEDTRDLTDVGPLSPIKATQIDKVKQYAKAVSSDSSLTMFEQLEQEVNDFERDGKKAKYFDSGKEDADMPSPRRLKEKKQYFDDTEPSVKVDRIKELQIHDTLRSPSIVHDDVPEDYEPTTINKIMRESFTKPDVAPAYDKCKLLLKSHDSIDIFEESPSHKIDALTGVETARVSIEKLALVDKQDIQGTAESVEKITHGSSKIETIEAVIAAKETCEVDIKALTAEIVEKETYEVNNVETLKTEVEEKEKYKANNVETLKTESVEKEIYQASNVQALTAQTVEKEGYEAIYVEIFAAEIGEKATNEAKTVETLTAEIVEKETYEVNNVETLKTEVEEKEKYKANNVETSKTESVEKETYQASNVQALTAETVEKERYEAIYVEIFTAEIGEKATNEAKTVETLTAEIVEKETYEASEIEGVAADEVTSANAKDLKDSTRQFKSVSKDNIDSHVAVDIPPATTEEQIIPPDVIVSSENRNGPCETGNINEVKLEMNIKKETMSDLQQPEKELFSTMKIKQERISIVTVSTSKQEELITEEEPIAAEINDTTNVQDNTHNRNTIDAFEDIYKDVTVPRVTEFELLVSDKSNETSSDFSKTGCDKDRESDNNDRSAIKYNLRHKRQAKADEIDDTSENTGKCAPKTVKKCLRLRRQKTKVEEDKLKDIVNLQKEFSDVTMDVPAPLKAVTDIPSPDKGEGENLPPSMGVQSCPAKSASRSRRKLFTPRAEPLSESPAGSSAERARVPRPSYHRPRTRRRLN